MTLDNSKRVQGEEASCISHSECLGQLRRGSISLLVDLLHACRPSGTGDSRELSVTVENITEHSRIQQLNSTQRCISLCRKSSISDA